MDQDLGAALRQFRRRRDVSLRELGAELGIHHSTVARRECGEIGMDRSDLLEMAAAVERIYARRAEEMTPADLLDG